MRQPPQSHCYPPSKITTPYQFTNSPGTYSFNRLPPAHTHSQPKSPKIQSPEHAVKNSFTDRNSLPPVTKSMHTPPHVSILWPSNPLGTMQHREDVVLLRECDIFTDRLLLMKDITHMHISKGKGKVNVETEKLLIKRGEQESCERTIGEEGRG